jgi:hypothetical protein
MKHLKNPTTREIPMRKIKEICLALRSAFAICFYLCFLSFPITVNAGAYQTSTPSSAQASDSESPLIALGPITALDTLNGSISINGQVIIFDDQTVTGTTESIAFGLGGTSLLSAGDYVIVTGELMDPGLSLATDVLLLDEAYVAGDSEAYLRVLTDQNNSTEGKVYSGDTTIDYSPALYSNSLDQWVEGTEVEFYGNAYENYFLAVDALAANESSQTQAIRGSGVRAIRGSGVRAIRGSGVRAIRGSGVRAIRGSGVRSDANSGTT